MKIAILGNGKMGKQISDLAKERGHAIVAVSSSEKPAHSLDISSADIAIDFSTPTTAFNNIKHAIESGIPVISGTTGWLDKLSAIEELCISKSGAFLYASNFSLGMNIFFELNKKLAKMMKNQNYKNRIHEIHHKQKLDSPSGTAITLENDIKDISGENTNIKSDRIDGIAGTHTIIYSCSEDEIEIKHTAKNKDGFTMGAILAAEWIKEKKGVFTLDDVLTQ
mgnify:FL=1